jgi:two-component system, chemotaxis family, protein-glutamate methylesterase/glutaminase
MIDISGIEAIVVGGSAGAFTALKRLVPALPPALAVPVLVVVHVPPDRPSAIPRILEQTSHVPLKEAADKEPLAPGTVYFAPPGYHLLVEADRTLALSTDEPVHHSRPSIDVLFESAADVFGRGLLGVILTGASSDGAAGMAAIARCGGSTIVQRPETAEQALMPQAALGAVTPTAVLDLDDIALVFSAFHAKHEARQSGGGSWINT